MYEILGILFKLKESIKWLYVYKTKLIWIIEPRLKSKILFNFYILCKIFI